jgi:DNA replication and repair protein RecF
MFLENLKISNFKNYPEARFDFSEKINCFFGNNGAGKTNILDAIHYLSLCKSYFNPIDSQNILFDESFFTIHGLFRKNQNGGDLVSCIQKRNQKKIFKLNDKEYDRLSDHIGLFPLVMISPYDRDLINEGSDIRRKYIDSVISQFDKIYLDNLIKYNKALLQRNILLKKFAEHHVFDQNSLEIWDNQLINYGRKIYEKREQFLNDFVPLFQHFFNYVSENKENVKIEYSSQLNERSLDELFVASLDKDRITRYTNTGIHKDDLELIINGHPVKKFGSQGQQKSFVIAIKLAQFEFTKNVLGYKPILLLDDIFDKLDGLRVKQIIHLVSENSFGQTFITDTQKERVENLFRQVKIDHKIFEIIQGQAIELENSN